MNAQFDLILPAFFIAILALGLGWGVKHLVRRIRSFLWASWRHIPRSANHVVGRDYHREFKR